MYGNEIWGWEEEEKAEKVQLKSFKWMLRLNRKTSPYIETERDKMGIESCRRVLGFDRK